MKLWKKVVALAVALGVTLVINANMQGKWQPYDKQYNISGFYYKSKINPSEIFDQKKWKYEGVVQLNVFQIVVGYTPIADSDYVYVVTYLHLFAIELPYQMLGYTFILKDGSMVTYWIDGVSIRHDGVPRYIPDKESNSGEGQEQLANFLLQFMQHLEEQKKQNTKEKTQI